MKILTLITALLLITSTQAQKAADLIKDFERSKDHLVSYIDAMPDDKLNDFLVEGSRTFKQQVLHIVQGSVGLVSNATGGISPFPKGNLEKMNADIDKTGLKKMVNEAFEFVDLELKKLNTMNPDGIIEKGSFKVSRMNWARKSYEHMIHHKGQCAVYLRLSDVVPPNYELF